MKCPICEIEMKNEERNSVNIDYCTQCRGVWLDRGELEKIVAQVETQSYRRDSRKHDDHDDHDDCDRPGRYERQPESQDRDSEYRRDGDYRYGRRKREGFLGNLFDMFGD